MKQSISAIYDFPQMREIYALIEEAYYRTDTLPSSELIVDRVNQTFLEMFDTLSDIRDGSIYEFGDYDEAFITRFTQCVNGIISSIDALSHNVQNIVEIHLINPTGTTFVRYDPICAKYRCYQPPLYHSHTVASQYA